MLTVLLFHALAQYTILLQQVSVSFRELIKALHFTPDRFIRTTEAAHAAAVQALWRTLVDNGAIYLGTYAGWYSVRDEAFYAGIAHFA